MTPRGGGDGEVVYAAPGSNGEYSVKFGPLPHTLKSFAGSSNGDFLANLAPLGDFGAEDLSEGAVERQGDDLILSFARRYSSQPEGLHLSLAVGLSGDLSYHQTRDCFEVQALSPCGAPAAECPRCPTCHSGDVANSASDNGTASQQVDVPISGVSLPSPGPACAVILLVGLLQQLG